MIPRSHPLASVGEAFNAVFVEAEAAGQLMFYGAGAGGAPTASAVLGDLVAVARNRLSGAARAGRVRLRRAAGPADGRDADPVPRQPRRGRPARRARHGRARRSPSTACRSRRSARTAAATRATLVIVTHTAPDAALAATIARRCGRMPRRPRASPA